MKGGGAAGVATIGAAGVEVVQQAVTDAQSALQPLIPYLDILRWLFIAVALIGVALPSTLAGMTGAGGNDDMAALMGALATSMVQDRKPISQIRRCEIKCYKMTYVQQKMLRLAYIDVHLWTRR